VHSCVERPSDVYRPEVAGPAARWLEVDSFEWSQRLYACMRAVDAAAAEAFRETPRRGRWPWQRGAERREDAPADPAPHQGNLDALRRWLRDVHPGEPLDPLPSEPWLDRLLPEWAALRAR